MTKNQLSNGASLGRYFETNNKKTNFLFKMGFYIKADFKNLKTKYTLNKYLTKAVSCCYTLRMHTIPVNTTYNNMWINNK